MWVAEKVRELDINELIDALDKATGAKLPGDVMVRLAFVHGASRAGSSVRVVRLDEGESYDESLDYEAVASLLNNGILGLK